MKTKIILTIVGTAIFFGGELFAQRMPQDSWYLYKEFRGDIEGGKFNGVRHASSDTSGNIYAADDSNHQVQVFDGNGNFMRKWGGYGTSLGKFARPHGIHVSSANKVYVAEYDGDRVQMFDTQGNYLKTFGRGGSGDGQMNGALDVTTDSAGNVYVADADLHRIMVFSSTGSYLRQWGSNGSGDGQFSGPYSLCTLPGDKIAVADTWNQRVQIFSSDGTFLAKFGAFGIANGQFYSPMGIRADSAGNIYVSQNYSDRVQMFNSSYGYVRTIGSEGSGNGNLQDPYGVVVANSKVYVPDGGNNRIAVFSSTGTWISNFGSYGNREFADTYGIAVDATGNIYISSHQDQEVKKLDKNYNFIKRFGSSGSGNGQFNGVVEMAAGPNNRLYVVDHSGHRVQIFDLEGNFVGKFGVNGSGDGQFNYPRGIAVSANRVYVADRDNHRIQIFDLNGSFIKKVGGLGSFGGQFSSPCSVSLLPNGNLVVGDRGNGRLQILDSEGNYLKKMDWNPERVTSSSDGIIYASWSYNGLGFVDANALSILREGGFSGRDGPMAELKNGDMISVGLDRVVRVWRRTFRTETPTTNNAIPLPVVISSSQRSGQKLLDLDYRVKDDDNATVTTAVVAFNAGLNTLDDLILVKNFTEGTGVNVGTNIATGVTKRLTWDIAKDWGSDFGQLQMEILAKDSRDLLNLDFIQMPAVSSDPLLKISRTPLNDSDFLSVWYWLLAIEDPGIKLTYGKVFPTNAATTFTYTGANGQPGLVGSYYPYTDFTGTPTVVTNQYINIRNWASASSPDTPIRWDKISARWTGRLVAETSGNHTIFFAVDDTGKIFMNNSTSASLNRTSGGESSFVTNLTAGTAIPITIEYTDTGGSRRAQLYWTPPSGTKQLIPPKNLFTGVAGTGGTYSYFNPDGTNHLASGTATTAAGRAYIFDKMGYKEATSAEVLRAKYAGTPGTINQWTPTLQVGPGERPTKVNAYNFETSTDGTWVVPK